MEQISFYVSNRAFGCWNLPSKICSQSWSDLWQKLQLPLTYICNLQFMYIPHPGSTVYSPSPWSGECKIACECSSVLITVIHFCLGLRKLTSPSSNVFWTVWLVWSQSHHHLLAVFHCCAPFIGYQYDIESISRSACWPTRLFMRNSPFTFAPWLPLLFHHAHWDQTEESVCLSPGSGPTLAQGPSAHVSLLFGTTFHYLSVQPPRLPPSEDVSKHTFSTWPFRGRHRCALLPVDDFNDFAFEHRSGCCATEPGYAGDIGAIEIWLIDNHKWHCQELETSESHCWRNTSTAGLWCKSSKWLQLLSNPSTVWGHNRQAQCALCCKNRPSMAQSRMEHRWRRFTYSTVSMPQESVIILWQGNLLS